MDKLTVAIIGNGDSNERNIGDLLDDFLPYDCEVLLPAAVPGYSGLDKVLDWLTAADVPNNHHADPIYGLNNFDGAKAVIVLGTAGVESDIMAALAAGIPVYDLTRGLYSVTSLYGPEIHAEQVEEVPEGEDTPAVPVTVEERLAILEAKYRELADMIGHTIRESGFSPVPVAQGDSATAALAHQQQEYSESIKIKYWHNTSNDKKRKAGRSKARPNEVEIWLTEEEAALL